MTCLKTELGLCLILCSFCLHLVFAELERHPHDGWFNNLQNPDWGAVDTHLLRRSRAGYSDGVYKPAGENRPNPLTISKIAFHGKDGLTSPTRNALLVFFGQQLVEEIVDVQRPGCPREYFNIAVPRDHKYNPHQKDDLEMPFLRARYDRRTGHSPNNPRQQLNEITPFLDGNLVYGAGKAVEDALREFKGGRLLTTHSDIEKSFPVKNKIRLPYANPPSPRDHILRPVKRFRRYGNPRTHENPFLVAMAVVWFRYHNRIAADLEKNHATWTDEEIFNAARKRTIAQYQNVVMYEWLPMWLGEPDIQRYHGDNQGDFMFEGNISYYGYDPNIHPGISTEFQAAAMRFGHTLVPSGVKTMSVRGGSCKKSTRQVLGKFTTHQNVNQSVKVEGVRLCNSYWVPEESVEGEPGLNDVIRGMIYTMAGREDNIIVSEIAENVFGPLEWTRRDIGALNIQRGRDVGLPGYNDVREAYGLSRRKTWDEIGDGLKDSTGLKKQISKVIAELKNLYGNTTAPDDLDLFVGGLLETTESGPGELFRRIAFNQFYRIRHGDRFWFENKKNGLFTDKELYEIRRTTFADVIGNVTNVFRNNIASPKPANIFTCGNTSTIPGCNCVGFDPDDDTMTQETCEPLRHYDYFSGSEGSFVATVVIIGLSIIATIVTMRSLVRKREKALANVSSGLSEEMQDEDLLFYATEWVSRGCSGSLVTRDVKVELDVQRKKLLVSNYRGHVFRLIDLRRKTSSATAVLDATPSSDEDQRLLGLKMPGEIDLVLHFTTSLKRDSAVNKLRTFAENSGWQFTEGRPLSEHMLWSFAFTVDERGKELTKFFKSIFSTLSGGSDSQQRIDKDVLQTRLTRTEFADALGLQPQSLFVRNMFMLVDADRDGTVSFEEFKTYFGILCSDTADQKTEMFFKMFDTSHSGLMSRKNYKKMIVSLLELQETGPEKNVDVDKMVDTVFTNLGKGPNDGLTIDDFKPLFLTDSVIDVWKSTVLDVEVAGETVAAPKVPKGEAFRNRAQTFIRSYKQTGANRINVSHRQNGCITTISEQEVTQKYLKYQAFTRYVDNHRRQIFWLMLYTLVTIAIFAERFYYYSCEREHSGLRRLAGYGVSVTRGAASAQMFTFASLLVTMCRNSLTLFRETVLHRIIPFDNAHDMHIYIAAWAMLFTAIHVIGHLFNFYHISTQASLDLNCYFREYFRATDELASFHYWTFMTMTGITGICLVLVMVLMYVFALPSARRHLFQWFSLTHRFYKLFYILIFLHGAARLVQAPLWPYFFLGPMVLFIIDKLVSLSRKSLSIPVQKAVLLPSGVLNLVFKRPLDFNYQAGQWVRIACPQLGKKEFHPFTLTSAPHEENLSLHIRAVGPWTDNIRRIFDPNSSHVDETPKHIYVDGPFGESHQDWYQFKVAVLIGGGIGITPFASILKDIAYHSKEVSRYNCEKVYFLWVTKTQKHFEWMTDVIRQVEQANVGDYVDVQICITELKQNYDLRTTMLYICERYFQKVSGLSMFTGLSAKTHFGRPNFQDFFSALKDTHDNVQQIGVFSCGPPVMTRNIQSVCANINAREGPSLIHHYENF